MRIQGPGWDVFAFLGNALQFAGKGIGYWEPHRPPFLSFLTSFFFRAGFVSETAIFVVDGMLFIAGLVGLYLLLNRRFDPILSFLGSLFFSSIIAVIWWVATGMTDVASVSLSIWAVYLFVMAVEEDSRYHWLAWPVAFAAVLTRFTAALMIFPILLILLTRGNILRQFKQIITGIAVSVGATIPYFYMNLKTFGDAIFPLAIAFGLVTAEGEEFTSPAKINKAWYIQHLREFIVPANMTILFYILVSIVLVGLAIYAVKVFSEARQKGLAVLGLILVLGGYTIMFLKMGLLVRQIAIFLLGLILFFILRDEASKNRFLWFDIAVLSWFLVYFDFHSHVYPFQRYFVTMAPAVTYFTVLGIDTLTHASTRKLISLATRITTSIILVTLFIGSSVWLYQQRPDMAGAALVSDIKQAASWLRQTDPDIASRKIYSDSWVDYSWYLKQNVKPMPFFKDKRAFTHALEKYNIDYYLTLGKRNIRSYDLIKQVGTNAYIYRKNPSKFQRKPRMLYIGRNWQNYIEDVTDFKYFVIYEGGKYGTGKSIYIDNYTLTELQKYPVILLYNFKWHDRKKAESLLADYIRGGGRIIIDATGNTASGVQYNLESDNFLKVAILRKSLPANPKIQMVSELEADHAKFSPFLSDGDVWYGATYTVIKGESSIRNLATAENDTLIGEQRIGKGKVYWLGYNLVWHAFHLKNKDEEKVIQHLFSLALRSEKNAKD